MEVREYFIPDFSNWQGHDAFEKAFQKLQKDLKAGNEALDWETTLILLASMSLSGSASALPPG